MTEFEKKRDIEILTDEDLEGCIGGQTSDKGSREDRDEDDGGNGGGDGGDLDIIVWDLVG